MAKSTLNEQLSDCRMWDRPAAELADEPDSS